MGRAALSKRRAAVLYNNTVLHLSRAALGPARCCCDQASMHACLEAQRQRLPLVQCTGAGGCCQENMGHLIHRRTTTCNQAPSKTHQRGHRPAPAGQPEGGLLLLLQSSSAVQPQWPQRRRLRPPVYDSSQSIRTTQAWGRGNRWCTQSYARQRYNQSRWWGVPC
jgi:hypothetical protein